MVLRKPPPPRLENLSNWHARSEPRSPASPSNISPSSPGQAQLNRFPSQDSVYSADLNTSPAFDLMPLEEAQRSPVGSSTSCPSYIWTDELGESSIDNRPGTGDSHRAKADHNQQWSSLAPVPGSQVMTESDWQRDRVAHDQITGEVPVQLQSNNPFFKSRPEISRQNSAEQSEWANRASHATASSAPLSQTEGYIPMTARLSLLDSSEQQAPWYEENPHFTNQSHYDTNHPDGKSPLGSQHSIKVSAPEEIYLNGGQNNPYAPAVVIQPSLAPAQDPHGMQPTYDQRRLGSDVDFQTPSAISSGTTATSHELIDLDGPSTLSVQAALPRPSSSVYSSEPEAKKEGLPSTGLLQTGTRSSEDKPSISSNPLSPAEVTRQKEQRAETYSIRQVNWTDGTGKLLQSPILVQNQNGPCPLLALVNALVLRTGSNTQSPIVRALRAREHISLGLLIEALFEELTTCLEPHEEFPDIEALTRFLTMLHTGMNVNPCLVLATAVDVGTFFQTADIRFYGTFGIPLIHGWLASWSSPEHKAMKRVAQYHEDIQLLPFRKQELEDRIMRGQSLSSEEEKQMADIQIIQKFVEFENATQLSPFGLTQLTAELQPGSVSIFFRNDHFSTLYKHPQSQQLFTLVTDAGYASHAEVVWESLVDVTGFNSEFMSGDFRAVGHGPSGSAAPAGPRTSSAAVNSTSAVSEAPSEALISQEQRDADYAYALSLQFQEDERTASQPGQANRRGPPLPARNRGTAPHMTNPPDRNSSIAASDSRSHWAPRGPDSDDPHAPPPPYEQAASGPRYSPPDQRVPQTSHHPSPPYSPNRFPQEQNQHRPVGNRHSAGRSRNSKDCVVM